MEETQDKVKVRRAKQKNTSETFAGESSWRDHAACIGKQEFFFEEKSTTTVAKAKAICATCVVKVSCLEHAMQNLDYGVWGGLTSNERRKARRVMKVKVSE